MKSINRLYTSKYGETLVRACSWCTKLIHQTPPLEKGRFKDENTIRMRKFSSNVFTQKEIFCSKECNQLHTDLSYVQSYRKQLIHQQSKYKQKKVERLLKTN